MYGIFLAIHVVVAVILIGFILIQQGKGAQAGAAFGSGASQTIFGSQGSANFLTRVTTYLAIAFFILNLVLAYIVNSTVKSQNVGRMTNPVETTETTDLPVEPAVNPAVPSDTDVPAVD